MSDATADSEASAMAAPAPEAHDVFYLLSIFFAVTSTTSFLLYLAWSYLKRHQEAITKKYHLDLVRYGLMNSNLDIGWSAMGWFSVSISFTIYNKWIMQLWEGGFDYPITMTALHMILKVIISRIWIAFGLGIPVPHMDWTKTLKVVIPIGVLTSVDIMFSNLSISLLPLSLYTALKTTVPVFTFVMAILLGLEKFNWRTFLAISCVVGGLSVAVQFRADGSMLGVGLVLAASLAGGLRWVLTQVLLDVDPASKNVMVAIYRFSPASVAFLLPLAAYFEWRSLYESKFAGEELALEAFCFSASGGMISIALIAFEIYLLRATSAVSLGIMGQFKEALQILMGVAIYKEHMSVQTTCGLLVSIVAANFYRLLKLGYFDQVQRGATHVEMAMRKNKHGVDPYASYNPVSTGGHGGDIDGSDHNSDFGGVTAALDVFLEVDSDDEAVHSDDDDMLLF